MGYKQFTEIKIVNKTPDTLKIKNAAHSWGKFYVSPDRDNEISPDDLNKVEIAAGGNYIVAACGKSDASSGCTGSFDLVDGNATAVSVIYDSPWGTSSNRFNTQTGDGFAVNQVGGNLNDQGGPLGDIQLTILKF
ncbi:aegerolysin type hemolysin [Xylariaceae sp. FL1272]|nr:aegerolysin type hemolysin [Xylariaceae sp. FL1272]